MRQYLAVTITAWACAACSLIYNPNNLPAAHDAAIDAEIIDPANPEIDSVAPAMIYEGQGDFGSRPALVVINGRNLIDSNTVVEIAPVQRGVQLSFGSPVIASSGHAIALAITAHVDRTLAQGEAVALDVKLTQTPPGGMPRTVLAHDKLALIGLKELDGAATPEVTSGTIDTTKLAQRYSKVDLSQISRVQLTGADRAVIVSMSSITAMQLDATGGNGAGGSDGGGGGQPVAGGCTGGSTGSKGGCGNSIGGSGGAANGTLSSAGGGGGGGFADDGMMGSGIVAGAGGSATGDPSIVTYNGTATASANRAGGGGGGGNPNLSGKGGGGGAGGGTIELTARGDLSVGAITANGGTGGPGSSGLTGNGAGGGGGAGGLILLRTDGKLSTSGPLSVAGGDGGAGVAGNGNGGRGSSGRVRWDALTGGPPSVPSGTLHRGPTFQLDTQVFRTPSPSITVIGTTNDRFDVYWDSGGMRYTGGNASIGSGSAAITPMLREGFNHLCITLMGGEQGASEADTCVDVAYLP